MAQAGRPLKYPKPEDLQKQVDKYFKSKRKVFTLGGLCSYLDLTYEGLDEYGRRDGFSGIVKKAKQEVAVRINEMALTNQVNANMAKLNLTCNFGWMEEEKKQSLKKEDDNEQLVEVISKLIGKLPS